TLRRLVRLKASAMTSSLKRSPRGKRRESRRSNWKKFGVVKALRPRSPLQPNGGGGPGSADGEAPLGKRRGRARERNARRRGGGGGRAGADRWAAVGGAQI